jgi:putative heme-binding domain-containing protein
MNRLQLMQSILDPSGEIAPQFVAWTMETRDGKTVTGMIVHENEGKTVLGNAEGETVELKTAEIVERVPQKTSVMPEKLFERMTVQELRDVLAFLEGKKR